ncbi:hypothetical protein [Paenibacillus sp. URB8-2]|uniref:hypothetical protein n=1 Tax=Paenibacillus sp. URB8-2 TaxID=2741301 RepID=UPI0015BA9D4B|nr:hypothetical protein [Paenibacillus sp. URB8-2]
MDDSALFRFLLQPRWLDNDLQTKLACLILYRYENVFFQVHRSMDMDDPALSSPLHQILLRMMNHRTLYGEEETVLDLYLLLQEDRQKEKPLYPSFHHLFTSLNEMES